MQNYELWCFLKSFKIQHLLAAMSSGKKQLPDSFLQSSLLPFIIKLIILFDSEYLVCSTKDTQLEPNETSVFQETENRFFIP